MALKPTRIEVDVNSCLSRKLRARYAAGGLLTILGAKFRIISIEATYKFKGRGKGTGQLTTIFNIEEEI